MRITRRDALLSAGLAAAGVAEAGFPAHNEQTPAGPLAAAMPRARIGRHSLSRLIVGGNPVSGNSHVSGALSREMADYFTAANAKKLLRDCERAGIDTWQSRGDRHILRLLNEYRLEGGRIQWIGQTASELADIPRNIRDIAAAGAIGIYHHGAMTDRLWAAGKIEEARERLKAMRDAGVLTGLGTHIPEVIDYAESKGWDLDFYMASVHNLSRTREEAARLAARTVDGELFWDPDRPEMLRRVRQTLKPCLVFKVYAASRKCASRPQMLGALRQVFQAAKPSDCVVIGMFPKYTEQVRENCALAVEALSAEAGATS
jgi:hypothetical protein